MIYNYKPRKIYYAKVSGRGRTGRFDSEVVKERIKLKR